MAAASRAAQRDADRRYKQNIRAQIVSDAGDAVDEWQHHVRDLVTIHADRADLINWNEIASRPAPVPPTRTDTGESKAIAALDAFKPRAFDFLSGGSTKRKQRLAEAIPLAIAQDRRTFEQAEAAYRSALTEWQEDVALSNRILTGDASAMRDVIQEMQMLASEPLMGASIKFEIANDTVHAIANIHNDEIVPKFRRKQLQSGRLSETKMPVGDFNELYQDYVCSAALRIGGDLLSLLPLDEVYVTCAPLMLDSATGHQQHTPVLSVRVVRETLDRLRLSAVDPSDAISNFSHAMNFKRAKGFARITPLKPIKDDL
jgi:hypothetical protein